MTTKFESLSLSIYLVRVWQLLFVSLCFIVSSSLTVESRYPWGGTLSPAISCSLRWYSNTFPDIDRWPTGFAERFANSVIEVSFWRLCNGRWVSILGDIYEPPCCWRVTQELSTIISFELREERNSVIDYYYSLLRFYGSFKSASGTQRF